MYLEEVIINPNNVVIGATEKEFRKQLKMEMRKDSNSTPINMFIIGVSCLVGLASLSVNVVISKLQGVINTKTTNSVALVLGIATALLFYCVNSRGRALSKSINSIDYMSLVELLELDCIKRLPVYSKIQLFLNVFDNSITEYKLLPIGSGKFILGWTLENTVFTVLVEQDDEIDNADIIVTEYAVFVNYDKQVKGGI